MDYRNDNPCDRIGPVLGPQQALVQHMRALPHREVGSALAAGRASKAAAVVKLAFEFLVLTAARSGEVRGVLWTENDEGPSKGPAADPRHAVRPTRGDRLGAPHRVDRRRAKGAPASRWSTFAYSNSVSIQQLADLGLQPMVVVVPGIRRAALQPRLACGQKLVVCSLLDVRDGFARDCPLRHSVAPVLALRDRAGAAPSFSGDSGDFSGRGRGAWGSETRPRRCGDG